MKSVSLKQGLKALGYEVVQYNKGYNFRSGILEKGNMNNKEEVINVLERTLLYINF